MDILQKILEHTRNIDTTNHQTDSPLMMSVLQQKVDVFRALVSVGARVDIQDRDGCIQKHAPRCQEITFCLWRRLHTNQQITWQLDIESEQRGLR